MRARVQRGAKLSAIERLMRTIILTLAVGVSVALSGCATSSSSNSSSGTAPAAASKTPVKPGEAKVGDTTTCPVSGETFVVAADSPKVDYNGKTYFFCCADCTGDFQKDPAKFTAKLQ
jgi:YHS domain-containing protein